MTFHEVVLVFAGAGAWAVGTHVARWAWTRTSRKVATVDPINVIGSYVLPEPDDVRWKPMMEGSSFIVCNEVNVWLDGGDIISGVEIDGARMNGSAWVKYARAVIDAYLSRKRDQRQIGDLRAQ